RPAGHWPASRARLPAPPGRDVPAARPCPDPGRAHRRGPAGGSFPVGGGGGRPARPPHRRRRVSATTVRGGPRGVPHDESPPPAAPAAPSLTSPPGGRRRHAGAWPVVASRPPEAPASPCEIVRRANYGRADQRGEGGRRCRGEK